MARKVTFYLLGIVLIVFFPFLGNSQCTPDAQYTSPGYYPDTLPYAELGQAYSETLTAVIPQDTTIDIGLGPQTLPIDSIVIESISDLPNGFTYTCNPPSCGFPGGTAGCLELVGNPVNSADVGSYNLIVNVKAYSAAAGALSPLDETVDYGTFKIVSPASVANVESSTFQFTLSPNPANREVIVSVSSPTNEQTDLRVFNVIGEQVYQQQVRVTKGTSQVPLSLELPQGMYFFTIENEHATQTQRLIIAH